MLRSRFRGLKKKIVEKLKEVGVVIKMTFELLGLIILAIVIPKHILNIENREEKEIREE